MILRTRFLLVWLLAVVMPAVWAAPPVPAAPEGAGVQGPLAHLPALKGDYFPLTDRG